MGTYTLSHTGKRIDDTLFSAARSVNTTHGVKNVTMFFTNNSEGMKAVINPVTASSAGVMTPEMLATINNIASRVGDIEKFPIECNVGYSTDGVNLVFSNNGQEAFSAEIGTATPSRAGLMPPMVYDAVTRTTIVFNARKVEGVAKLNVPPMVSNRTGMLCFDVADNTLCLQYNSTYHTVWQQHHNVGYESDYYKSERPIIAVEGKFYSYDLVSETWVNVGKGEEINPDDLVPKEKRDQWDEAYSWGDHSDEGYAKIYKVSAVPASYTTEDYGVDSVNAVLFDAERKVLVGITIGGGTIPKFFSAWASDPNGMKSIDYSVKGVCLVVGNDIYKFNGRDWEQVFALNFDPDELIPQEKQDKWDAASDWVNHNSYSVNAAVNWVNTNGSIVSTNARCGREVYDWIDSRFGDLSVLGEYFDETDTRIAYLYDLSQYKDLALIKQLTTESNNLANAASQKVDGYEERVQEVYTAYREGRLKGGKGDKGDQGNSGYTGAAGELEVVNNLTQGGATAALSAEMGKYLYEHSNYDIIYEWDWERMTEAQQEAYVREHPNLVVLEGRNPESGSSYFENGTLHLDGSISDGVLTLYSATYDNGTLTL